MPASPINSLWFKRDLRLNDHAPLLSTLAGSQAARPLLLLCSFEPTLLADPNDDLRHWRFVTECLADLNQRLPQPADNNGKPVAPTHEWLPFAFEDESAHDQTPKPLGQPGPKQVWIFQRDMPGLLADLHRQVGTHTLFSHQEMGLEVTFDRDRTVAAFCRENGIDWQGFQYNGVIRPLKNREQWRDRWQQTMQEPTSQPDWSGWHPATLPPGWYDAQRGPALPAEWHLPNPPFQPGGAVNAHWYLHRFLSNRITLYAQSISKPQASRRGCSRLSPYLAWGCLSIRQVVQAQQQAARTRPRPTALGQAEIDRILTRHTVPDADDRPQTQPKKAAPKPKKSKPAEVRAEDIVQHISSII